MSLKCPKCDSIIYSRRNVLCGVCGERLPQELLFNPEQREGVDRELQVLKEREKEMREVRNRNSGPAPGCDGSLI